MIFLQSLSDLLLAHPFAIVDHLIQNTVFFSGNVDLHRALPDHTAETVVDGILYDRLQKEFSAFRSFPSPATWTSTKILSKYLRLIRLM